MANDCNDEERQGLLRARVINEENNENKRNDGEEERRVEIGRRRGRGRR